MKSQNKQGILHALPSPNFQYEVLHFPELGVLVKGLLPTADMSALARSYDYSHLRYVSTKVPIALGVYGIAFMESPTTEKIWLELIESSKIKES